MNNTNNTTPETRDEDIRHAYDHYLRRGHERYELNDVSLDSMGLLLDRKNKADRAAHIPAVFLSFPQEEWTSKSQVS